VHEVLVEALRKLTLQDGQETQAAEAFNAFTAGYLIQVPLCTAVCPPG